MEISEIKQRLSLADVFKHFGYKADKNMRMCCPFHEDKTPSMQVYWKEGTCFCFSSNCKTNGKKMDAIDIVMYSEGYDSLGQKAGKHAACNKCVEMINGNVTPPYIQKLQNRPEFMNYIFTYFKNAIVNSGSAKEYLQKRGLNFKLLDVGYNAAQFHQGMRKDQTLIKSCVDAGLLIPYKYNTRTLVKEKAYKAFGKDCIAFALRNEINQIESLYFRSTVNEDDQKHFYLKNRKGLYPGYPKPETKKLLLTEAIIDGATLLQIPEVAENYTILSTYGTNGLNEEHIKAIEKLKNLDEIIFSFDGDESGRIATRKYAEILISKVRQGVEFTQAKLPEGEDVNSFYLKYESSGIIQLIEEREIIFDSTLTFKENTTPITQNESEIIFSNENKNIPQPKLDTSCPNKLIYTSEHGIYSVLGNLPKETDKLIIGLHAELKTGDKRFRKKSRHDKVNLYEDRVVNKIAAEIAEKLDLNKTEVLEDLQVLINLVEEHRDNFIQQTKDLPDELQKNLYVLSSKEREEAVNFLKQQDLVKQLIHLLGETGIVGEERNRIFLFLVAYSYKMKDTLNALIQGSSASGKTRLLKQIAACMPKEDIIIVTRLSDKSLYNFPEYFLQHKIIFIEDYDGLSEEALLALRELISNGMIISAVSIKLDNGQIVTGQRTVRGPISTVGCTTRGYIYEDNMSRVFIVAVDESAEQTSKIIDYQNKKAAGIIDAKKEVKLQKFIKNLVRVLEPLEVVNPYATKIQLPREAHKIRRLNDLFQNFIKQIVLLHQYQRKKDSQGRLIAELTDIEMAVNIMFESILLKVDELDGSIRQFFESLKNYVEKKGKDYRFNRFEIREATGVSKTQQHHYITKLIELEYLQQNGHPNRGFVYKIVYWDDYTALKLRIKNGLFDQIKEIKKKENPGTENNNQES
ncbi:MAG: toprim domain-containing protein [Bacteroidota bacterium]|nr:toprim domain-containing protein [Bacteroidota bacterium]